MLSSLGLAGCWLYVLRPLHVQQGDALAEVLLQSVCCCCYVSSETNDLWYVTSVAISNAIHKCEM